MTDEELAEIKARVLRFTPADETVTPALFTMTLDARALLAEVERLRSHVHAFALQRITGGTYVVMRDMPCTICGKTPAEIEGATTIQRLMGEIKRMTVRLHAEHATDQWLYGDDEETSQP